MDSGNGRTGRKGADHAAAAGVGGAAGLASSTMSRTAHSRNKYGLETSAAVRRFGGLLSACCAARDDVVGTLLAGVEVAVGSAEAEAPGVIPARREPRISGCRARSSSAVLAGSIVGGWAGVVGNEGNSLPDESAGDVMLDVEGDTSREKAACCCRWKAAEAAFEGDRRIGR